MTLPHPSIGTILDTLKDFQRETVEYVFRRLYTDSDSVSRFLIADEVGLGKTLVARGIIARAVEHLWDEKKRIDIIYICSNQDIAQQNTNRLRLPNIQAFSHATRATLLPIRIQRLKENRLNFVSLTPGTSFNLRSHGGAAWERVLLFIILREIWADADQRALSHFLRLDVGPGRWEEHLRWFSENEKVDDDLKILFWESLEASPIRQEFDALSQSFDPQLQAFPGAARWKRAELIGKIRQLLAHTCMQALEPDVIILDEFQRFKQLLDPKDPMGYLADELFRFEDAKVLLLSATPYKMYTIYGEEAESHFDDFKRTTDFLLDSEQNRTELAEAIREFRHSLLWLDASKLRQEETRRAKARIESILHKVMVRTERLAVSEDRNGMLNEKRISGDTLTSKDFVSFVHLDRIAHEVGADDQVEYWKSSAYPLNLMEDYQLKRKFDQARGQDSGRLATLIGQMGSSLMNWEDIRSYREIEPGNPHVRALMQETVQSHNWKCLWLPPSLPYYGLEGPFEEIESEGRTKTLIFSAWKVVPKVISVLLSYEAERQIIQSGARDFAYDELTEKKKRLIDFKLSQGRPAGMSAFALLYPCVTLAREVDPLAIAKGINPEHLPGLFYLRIKTKQLVERLLRQLQEVLPIPDAGPGDDRWFWAAPVLMDRFFAADIIYPWLFSRRREDAWEFMQEREGEEEYDPESRFADHVNQLRKIWDSPQELGRFPDELADTLVSIALASPAVCTLRSLLRTLKKAPQPALVAYAARGSLGFRTLFNQPDTIVLLQSLYKDEDIVYWRAVLKYCAQGNLQAVLDEYFHVLYESLGLSGLEATAASGEIAAELKTALALRAPSLRFDEIDLDQGRIISQKKSIRCRYAVRFGADKNELEGVTRDIDVRTAFNSPFRPFVLATTSLGQEGLDFHQYCHRIVHWNLPANPVDLEQREGRIHRYKGHVIRRNVADHYGYQSIKLDANLTDAWAQLFSTAVLERSAGVNDLIPYWIYEKGRFKIERQVPVLPLSAEVNRLRALKKTLVAYRSVIGMARQDELLDTLMSRFPNDAEEMYRDLVINLSPSSREL